MDPSAIRACILSGLAKNTYWLNISFGMANLYMAQRPLLVEAEQCV